jgi:hypothetical protein
MKLCTVAILYAILSVVSCVPRHVPHALPLLARREPDRSDVTHPRNLRRIRNTRRLSPSPYAVET